MIMKAMLEVVVGYVGKVSSSVGSAETYTEEFIAHVTEHTPELLHLLGL